MRPVSSATGTSIGRAVAVGPVVVSQRLFALDALRGFAILGILLVNVGIFSGAQGLTAPTNQYGSSLGVEEVLVLLISVFAEGKLLTSLSLLFGVGFVWQAMRAESRGVSSGGLLFKRCIGLGLIGIVHAVFIWSGDILFTYALLGVVLIAFRGRRPRTLLIWAGALVGVPLAAMIAAAVFTALSGVGAGGAAGGAAQASPAFIDGLDQSAMEAYNSGSYLQMVLQRIKEIAVYALAGLSIGPALLAMMLAGAAVSRAGWVEDLAAHFSGLRRAAVIGVGFGLPLNVAYAASLVVDPAAVGAVGLAGLACWFAGAPMLAVGYMALSALLALRYPASGLLRRVSAVGRLALSNYLTQSLVMTAVFYGLSLYGRISLMGAMLIALVLLAIQILVSPLYLRRFSHGPIEWLWRRMTYGPGKTASR